MSDSPAINSFGKWVRRRREFLDLTQATLAHRVGCAAITIRKIESDERRPSRQMAARLALSLALAKEESARFVAVALGEQQVDRLPVEAFPSLALSGRPPIQQALVEPGPRQPLPEAVTTDEIRVVTIVVVGISHSAERRLSQHPDESAELMDRVYALIRAVFAEQEIHIEESLEGHVIALFGAPHRHEDDPERALQAALHIQSGAQNLGAPLAIAVHSGPAYLNQAKQARTNAVLGATVTLARRLHGQAGDGQILVSTKVYRQTRRAFDFKQFDPALNGPGVNGSDLNAQAASEAAYLLLSPRQHMEKSRGIEGYQPPLIGRARELAELEELANALTSGVISKRALSNQALSYRAIANGVGQIVILSGEAGVGKSTLLARLKANVTSSGASVPHLLWLEGRSLEMTMSTGYGPFLDLLRAYFAWQPDDDEATRAGRLLSLLQELAGAGHLSEAQVEKIGPLLGNLFSLHFSHEWDEQLLHTLPEQIRQQTFRAIYDLLIAMARRQPLLLVFEDLHWADGVSLDLIAQLMEALPTVPLMLLCVCRPQQAHRSNQLATVALRKCPSYFTEITLRELPPPQSQELLHALLGPDLPEKVADLILTRAQGNPFFIEEMAHTLISMDLLYRADNRWWARPDLDEAIVPDTVNNLLLSRVDSLAPTQKSLLHHAAVIGRHFSLPLLALTTPAYKDHDEQLWQLEEQAFIYQERTLPEAIYTFRHILTHEAIYATIPRRRAKALHGDVARVLEKLYAEELPEHYEPLAYHYERSKDLPKAVDYLLKAAHKARRAYLNEEAIGYFKRALACLDELPTNAITNEQRLTTLTELGQTYYHGAAQHDQAVSAFRQALALAKTIKLPPRRMARILVWLGDLLMNWNSQWEESLSLGHEALALLGNDNQCNEAGWANALISFSHLMMVNMDEAIEYALRSASFAHRLPCTEELDHLVYLSIVCAYVELRQAEKARWWLELSTDNAKRGQHLHAYAEAAMCLSNQLALEGNPQAGIANMQNALDVMLQSGDLKRCNWCDMGLLWFYLQLGDLQALRELAPPTLVQTQLLNQEYLQDLLFCLGISALVAGAWQEAESRFREDAQLCELNTSFWVEAQVAIGYALLAQDKTQDKRGEAISVLKAAVSASLGLPNVAVRMTKGARWFSFPLSDALTALDAALADDDVMRNFCENLQAAQKGAGKASVLQCFLERAEVDQDFQGEGVEFSEREWQWCDRFGGSSISPFFLAISCKENLLEKKSTICEAGVTIQAANGRELWFLNSSAPRFSRPIQGDFVLQTRCEAPSGEKPALGGIVLWQSLTNFLRLDWGSRGVGEISLMGTIDGRDAFVGRGRLRSPHAYLRLECRGDRIRALCSADGEEWYLVGQTQFSSLGSPEDGPLEIGLYATGNIDRLLYPGRYPDGAAIRFSDTYLSVSDRCD